MSDMAATMARVSEIAGTLRSMRETGTVRTASASSGSAATSSTTSSASSSTTSSTPSAATSSAAFASALAGATAGVNGATPAATRTRAAVGSSGGVDGDAVVADAKRYLGIRYTWGGTDPATGLDCSGLTQRVFADLGVKIPRTVAQQQHAGTAVPSMGQARPGDLLVLGTHHIGIYVGDGKMLHAPHRGDVVKIAKVYDTPTKIRRVVDGSADTPSASSATYVRPTALRGSGSTAYDDLFAAATRKYDLPAGLLKAVARAESNFNPRAHSPAGAIGLMQIMPGTARELGVDPRDPAEAVDGAARLLRSNLRQFDGSVRLAVAAYNAGPGAVRRYDGVPPYAETRTYVQRVLAGIERYAA
ncbi:MAG TPA: transglycosylase SLT domain-containing protein [Actinomycetales bacterium]|nr:transglycosylase SLT domain-containing protein [Actinomycetales bacterium]